MIKPVTTECGHLACHRCIEKWVTEKYLEGRRPGCVLCRQRIKINEWKHVREFQALISGLVKKLSPMDRFVGVGNFSVQFFGV